MRRIRIVAILLLLAVSAAGAAIYLTGFTSNTSEFEGERSVYLPSGSQLETVTDSLLSAGVLKKRWTFETVARVTGWGDQIKSGHYALAAGLSNMDMLDVLRRGLESPIRVTIREGTRADFMARALGKVMAFDSTAFRSALRDVELAQSLGTDTTHLFSYLLPDTYFFYWETPPEELIAKVKESFDAFYDTAAASAPGPFVDLTKEEIISVASIVEWESNHVPEKPTIAGVYLNRLRDRWALDADPTIQYALILTEGSKRRLFNRDYRMDHPYNTYKYRGVPPGPITNPTRTSIEAVLDPELHHFYFFVARGDGTHIFSRTLSEHVRNAQAYYRVMRQRRAEAARQEAADLAN